MVVIEGGRFWMGSAASEARIDDETPQHLVAVQPFALSRCEITVGQFRVFVEDTGYRTAAEDGDGCNTLNEARDDAVQRADANWRAPGTEQGERDPVVCVAYADAQAYADWLSQRTGARYRLPTEAEWEYAARAGTVTDFALPAPEGGSDLSGLANCSDCGGDWAGQRTAPAASYPANGWGLHDLHGNVYEWTQDCWHEDYGAAPVDGRALQADESQTCERRVVRGGSWIGNADDARSAFRGRDNPVEADFGLGFRVARTL